MCIRDSSEAVDPHGRPASSAQRRAHPCTSVDRSGRPPMVKNSTVGAFGRPPGSTEPLEQRVNSLSVDPCGRPGFPESKLSGAVDPHGRPASSAQRRARLCTLVDRAGRPTSGQVDLLKPGNCFSGIKKLVFLAQIKSHKILKNLQK